MASAARRHDEPDEDEDVAIKRTDLDRLVRALETLTQLMSRDLTERHSRRARAERAAGEGPVPPDVQAQVDAAMRRKRAR